MKKVFAALLFLALVTTVTPASANHSYPGNPHAGRYTFGGVESNSRAFWVMDRTGLPNIQSYIANTVTHWNNLAYEGNLFLNGGASPSGTNLPVLNWFASEDRDCSYYANQPYSYSVITVCHTTDPALNNGSAYAWGSYQAINNHTISGKIEITDLGLEQTSCNLRTTIVHELGHVMGLTHISPFDTYPYTTRSVMSSIDNGGPTAKGGCPTWFNNHDKYQLQVLYNHPLP